jgi:hypothetical protein
LVTVSILDVTNDNQGGGEVTADVSWIGQLNLFSSISCSLQALQVMKIRTATMLDFAKIALFDRLDALTGKTARIPDIR